MSTAAFEAAVAALAVKFRERCAREGAELVAMVESGEVYTPRFRHLTHGLAGTGGSFGFHEVSASARHVEEGLNARTVQPEDISRFFAALTACAQGSAP